MSSDNSRKEYIVKLKDTKLYLKSVDTRNIQYTLNLEEAERVNKKDVRELSKINELETVKYKEEQYQVKKEKYKLYIQAIIKEDDKIEKDNLIYFLQEYEGSGDKSGKYTSYLSLKEEYPNSKIIDEIVRVGQIIKYQDIVKWHEAIQKLSEDKKFNEKNDVKYNITEDDIKQYKKAKLFLEEAKEKYPYDYDAINQYEILDTSFREKYITEDLYKEFYKMYYEEEYEQEST